MISSIAWICSGTAGHPKCRSETWKTVIMSSASRDPGSGREDEIGEMRRDVCREGGRKRPRGVANRLAHPANLSHARIDHLDPQNRNARTTATTLETKLDGEKSVARTLETDEPAHLRLERIAHGRLGEDTSAQPLRGERPRGGAQ